MRLRYAFEAGSGVCLWAQDTEAQQHFADFAIELEQLALSRNTDAWLRHLLAWFDTSLDWDDPARAGACWDAAEQQRFVLAARHGLQLLQQELPGHWQICSDLPVEPQVR